MKWEKVRGGLQVEWVGYLLDLGRFEIGITESRAAWAVRWLTDKAAERRVPLGELRGGFGRITCIFAHWSTSVRSWARSLLGRVAVRASPAHFCWP